MSTDDRPWDAAISEWPVPDGGIVGLAADAEGILIVAADGSRYRFSADGTVTEVKPPPLVK